MADQKSHHRVRNTFIVVLLLVLIGLTAGGVKFILVRQSMQVRINQQLRTLASQGYPVTLEELNDWYKVPDGEKNAASLYMEAIDHLKEWDPDAMSKMPLLSDENTAEANEALNPATVELMEKYLTAQTETLGLLKEAAKLKYCRYPADFRYGQKMQLNWLPEIRSCQRVLCIQMQLAVAKDNVSDFMEAFTVSTALVRSLEQEPTQVSQVVRVACLGMSMTVLEQALSRLTFTEKQLADLSDQLASHKDTQAWVRGTAGVVCEQINRFRNPDAMMASAKSEDVELPGWLSKLYWVMGWADRDTIEYLDVARCALTPGWQTSRDLLSISKALKAQDNAIPKTHFLTNIGCSGWDQVFDLYVQHMVQMDCAKTVLAIKRYELQHRSLPETLEALVPQFLDVVPIDPFDGKPIRFQCKDNQVMVYSVGKNGQNHRDWTKNSDLIDQSYDLSFTVKQNQVPPPNPDPQGLTI